MDEQSVQRDRELLEIGRKKLEELEEEVKGLQKINQEVQKKNGKNLR